MPLPCSVCGSSEPSSCWAEDDEAAIDAAAAKTAATADLMPCSMAACSEQGRMDDKATDAHGARLQGSSAGSYIVSTKDVVR